MRLDEMMEVERQNDLQRLEERNVQRISEMRKGAQVIQQQIEERRVAALLESERRDQETKLTLQAIAQQAENEKCEKASKLQMQRELMNQVVQANQDAIARKKSQKLADQEEDRKLLAYLVEKEQKEIQKDREFQAKKAEREKELARLRAAQKRATDKLAEQDALRAKRAYEAYEREWRKKEKETVERKIRDEQALREERAKQQAAREQAIAIEALHLREEFFDNLKRQKELEEKMKRDAVERIEKNRQYSKEVKAQIQEREGSKKKEREDFFNEGARLEAERLDKRKKINSIRERKLTELRSLGIPEKYCKEVERKIYLSNKTKLT
jgi:hypothetical protein